MEIRVTHHGFARACMDIAGLMGTQGQVVDTGHWQSLSDVPQTRTVELRNVTLVYQIPALQDTLVKDVDPNLPWADLHFEERVGGDPTNPGKTYHLWPYFRGNVPKHQNPEDGDKFSHTYMERIWPRFAPGERYPDAPHHSGERGIRYRYGDLEDVVSLLATHPFTRQAYLPIWFPEDTGATMGQRVPCTLGYHFMRRDDRLHLFYPIRSCDFFRHFRDDVYLAARLVQWVIDRLAGVEAWRNVIPGELTMTMHSLHVFEPERGIVRRLAGLSGEDADDDWGAAV